MTPPEDPLADSRESTALLRRAVREVAASQGRRHHHRFTVHIGTPGGETTSLTPDRGGVGIDLALATDVVTAMIRRVGPGAPALGWVARSGPLEPQDADLCWLAAMHQAAAETGVGFPTALVTRRGWHDPASGTGRVWARVRPT